MPKPQIPANERVVSGNFATQARYALAENLRASTYYFTFCPEMKAAHVGLYPGRQCGLCDGMHPWLELTRDEVKELADKNLPENVAHFIDSVNINNKY